MSKHFTLLFAVICISIATKAQIGKGSTFLGGDFAANYQKTKWTGQEDFHQTGISVSPVFGKAIRENLVLGLDANVGIFDNGPGNAFKSHSYGGGIIIRKYKPIGSGFNIFLQGRLGVGINRQETNSSPNSVEIKRTNIGINAYPGISYVLSKKLHLESGFNNLIYLNYYNENRTETGSVTNNYKMNGFNIGSSLNNMNSFYFGFRLFLSK